MSRCNRTEVTVREGVADVVELGVIEGVEEFRAEFQFASAGLAEQELLNSARFQFWRPGPRRLLKGRLPQVPATVGENAEVLNQLFTVFG